jgi:hypothetical protein
MYGRAVDFATRMECPITVCDEDSNSPGVVRKEQLCEVGSRESNMKTDF